ncbi:hypothetical protein EV13_2448 [Prochlorococcus sp. MIT 0702]|nr:hypothetical protein EV12_2231 [Prochlorococcus sp. MIT 0701]KGG26316.1 hypothetical protein EV13_2448 [Prochlorococcus sp. MIT 0702]KGG31269.1 hypothetical protein EV14_2641 [Prochlorococcus sp. MIT 0703]
MRSINFALVALGLPLAAHCAVVKGSQLPLFMGKLIVEASRFLLADGWRSEPRQKSWVFGKAV